MGHGDGWDQWGMLFKSNGEQPYLGHVLWGCGSPWQAVGQTAALGTIVNCHMSDTVLT